MHELRVLLGNGAPPRAQEPRVDHGSWHGMHLPGSDHGPAAAAAVAPGASGNNPSRIPHVIICCRRSLMDVWHFLGDLHPKLVHFPLVLLLAGLLFDLFGLLTSSDRAHWAARVLTVGGTLTLLFAFICGIYAEVWAGRALIPHHQIELHELAANVASWGFVILAAWRLFLDPTRRLTLALYTLIALAWYVLLVITAHL